MLWDEDIRESLSYPSLCLYWAPPSVSTSRRHEYLQKAQHFYSGRSSDSGTSMAKNCSHQGHYIFFTFHDPQEKPSRDTIRNFSIIPFRIMQDQVTAAC